MYWFIAFTKEGFADALEVIVPLVAVIAALSLSVELLNSFLEYVCQLVLNLLSYFLTLSPEP